jgi:hypothetical protein
LDITADESFECLKLFRSDSEAIANVITTAVRALLLMFGHNPRAPTGRTRRSRFESEPLSPRALDDLNPTVTRVGIKEGPFPHVAISSVARLLHEYLNGCHSLRRQLLFSEWSTSVKLASIISVVEITERAVRRQSSPASFFPHRSGESHPPAEPFAP